MYHCLIAADNKVKKDLLVNYLSGIKNITYTYYSHSLQETALLLANSHIDIVFSSGNLIELLRMEIVNTLEKPPAFIFIQTYNNVDISSLNTKNLFINFIAEPLTFKSFCSITKNTISFLNARNKNALSLSQQKRQNLNHAVPHSVELLKDYFFIKSNSGYTKINFFDILYFESLGDFSKIQTVLNTKYVVLVGLKSIERQVSNQVFKRVHKQFIVNLMHIVTVTPSELFLTNKNVVPTTSIYKQDLMKSLIENKLLKRF